MKSILARTGQHQPGKGSNLALWIAFENVEEGISFGLLTVFKKINFTVCPADKDPPHSHSYCSNKVKSKWVVCGPPIYDNLDMFTFSHNIFFYRMICDKVMVYIWHTFVTETVLWPFCEFLLLKLKVSISHHQLIYTMVAVVTEKLGYKVNSAKEQYPSWRRLETRLKVARREVI